MDIGMQNSNFETSHFTETNSDREVATSTDAAESGGLRGARIASVLAQINEGFSDQQFSTRMVAERLGLSVRYVQDLLQGSGHSITDRIMQLRLDKARTMLTDDRNCSLKISDVAASCGFNELSYFHRSFRRRFGSSPAKFRVQSMNG
ncbi:AraC family transcriptional regulator [Tardiphaga sp.]|uniref:helix-turn-helix transcriptional regulator n=1 Tax=Tardiphaga sp. TaxID=1926292 RepID=UPI002618BF49|nr:AraC family transcriptional regulator [Tardiphaga sp.]